VLNWFLSFKIFKYSKSEVNRFERLKCLIALHANFNFSTSYNVLKVRIRFSNSKTTKNIPLFICHSESKKSAHFILFEKILLFSKRIGVLSQKFTTGEHPLQQEATMPIPKSSLEKLSLKIVYPNFLWREVSAQDSKIICCQYLVPVRVNSDHFDRIIAIWTDHFLYIPQRFRTLFVRMSRHCAPNYLTLRRYFQRVKRI